MERIPDLYKYKQISFDLWLTLIKSNPEFKSKRNLLFKDYFGIGKPIEEVALAIRKFDILTNSINEKAGKNFDTFEIYYLILDHLGIDIELYTSQHLAEFYVLAEKLFMEYKPVLLYDYIPSLFQKLHSEGITTNILSNTAFIKGSALRKVIAHYGLEKYFSFQLYSDETGFSKPSPNMYQCAYDEIMKIGDIAKHEVLHIGDNKVSDYDGALAFGFKAHLLINTPLNEPHLQPA
ncbi:phosphoglycolate phosphatase [Flavobacterium album]|uniref:Phosphoglycolate phosphatase n=1 Tax=Flavobacterium album TaxID=2175091 RepID=A0A2S1QZ52_9FLAO|nr:HAD family hydrolase [Flavobacterium album]AWH85697.1 phosphoglycolate phosphatase [Flavobacterium album]